MTLGGDNNDKGVGKPADGGISSLLENSVTCSLGVQAPGIPVTSLVHLHDITQGPDTYLVGWSVNPRSGGGRGYGRRRKHGRGPGAGGLDLLLVEVRPERGGPGGVRGTICC